MDLSVVVPTFREALNLRELTQRLCAAFTGSGIEGEIVIVDDNSNDGTEELCKELSQAYPVRLLVRREERGLATAVIHGMRAARGKVFLCMDADLSHPPESVPQLYRAIADGQCDISIGSRYVEGGSVEEGWGLFRWLNSKVATSLARGLTPVKDPMGGFFALRREVFETAPPLAPLGYKILLEILAKCPKARAKELPIEFKDRKFGESKLNMKQQVLYLRHLRWLYQFRYPVLSEMFQYGLVGFTGLIVDLLVFSLMLPFVHHRLDRAISFVIAATWNWAWNRRITFEGARSRSRFPQWAAFLVVSAMGFAINWGVYVFLTDRWEYFFDRKRQALVVGVVVGFAANYLGARMLVFGKSIVARAGKRKTASEPESVLSDRSR